MFIKKDKLFVSFNLAGIPRDMNVTSMVLHVPLLSFSTSTTVYIKEITTGWSEKAMKKGDFPLRSKEKQILKCAPGQEEIIIDMTGFEKKWRLKERDNYGIYIRLKNKDIKYIKSNPTFLIIDTI
ncbi:hypothetical protein [Alkaliphilus metalliredigens]|nr:hypothetical protein [Alkaliphilus metalliredigens]